MQPPSMIRQTVCPSDITFRSGAYFLSPFPSLAHTSLTLFLLVSLRSFPDMSVQNSFPILFSLHWSYLLTSHTECLLIKWCAMI